MRLQHGVCLHFGLVSVCAQLYPALCKENGRGRGHGQGRREFDALRDSAAAAPTHPRCAVGPLDGTEGGGEEIISLLAKKNKVAAKSVLVMPACLQCVGGRKYSHVIVSFAARRNGGTEDRGVA